jgi:hypothetical protein
MPCTFFVAKEVPMERYLLKLAVCGAISALYTGCSMDSLNVVEHATQVKPGATVQVKLGHGYIYLSNTSVTSQEVTRDSLHVFVGAQGAWKVESVSFYKAENYQIGKSVTGLRDSMELRRAFMDSATIFESRAIPMTQGTGNGAKISGQDIEAHNGAYSQTITVATDSVKHWFEFHAPVAIRIAAGTVMDTVFEVNDSLLAQIPDSQAASAGPTLKAFGIDSVGVKVIPVFIYAKLTAPSTPALDTIFYFTKTARIPAVLAQPASPTSGSYDIGDMAFVPVEVTPSAPVLREAFAQEHGTIAAYPNPFRDRVTITLGHAAGNISVYAQDGMLVKKLSPMRCGTIAVWDGTDTGGRRIAGGVYIVRADAAEKTSYLRIRAIF